MNILVLGMIVGALGFVLGLVECFIAASRSDDAAGCSGTLLSIAGGVILALSGLMWLIKIGWLYF